MRILAISQYGWPEPHPALSPLEKLAERGHYVYAITGMPNYPMGDIYKGYEKKRAIEEHHNGIDICHVPVIPRKHNAINRLLNYHSYPISAKKQALDLEEKFDVIFANQSSPVMMVQPAISYAKKHNKKIVMYCMDLWPASLCVGGVSKNSFLYKYYWKVSRNVYENVDVIMVTSKSFKDYFTTEFGITEDKIVYLPQYSLIEQEEKNDPLVKDTTDFVFAGNVGTAQNLEVVLRAAKEIEKNSITDNGKSLRFHIVGDGQALDSLKKSASVKALNNVIFHGRKTLEEMPKYYAMADAMMVTMIPDPFISLTLPAKVQSYMAAGKPIIASADGEIERVIRESQCGFCAKAGNVEAFVDAVKSFIQTDNRNNYGINGKRFYDENFSEQKVIDKLERILSENCI